MKIRRKNYVRPDFVFLDILAEDRTLLTDGSGSQFDDIGDGGEAGGDGWDIY